MSKTAISAETLVLAMIMATEFLGSKPIREGPAQQTREGGNG